MNSERWQQIETLFHDASELAPDARGPFLESACAGDAELRNQVEALLQSLEESGDFIEAPPVAQTVSSPTASFIGRAIGHYKVVSLLGAGGMGEVYLARDSKLDRPIALKILPAQFTADPMQVQRFAREARAASALNHPNIITIHEIGHDAGAHFIATEFIAGETLREKINRGKIELKEALRIATQIADALSAAHAAGIVHRDIKPENVMVRPDGLVKVLDFGLAKPAERQMEGETGGQGDRET
ncbi:MAG TPA: serine/threonine-protein kinase, partial [Blastocatellia bacterium]